MQHLKQAILKLKTQAKADQNALVVKTSVFDIPREVWRSGFNAFQMGENRVVTFSDYSKQKDNPDFVRDFNLACSTQPHLCLLNTATKDAVHVNKGFLDAMFLD